MGNPLRASHPRSRRIQFRKDRVQEGIPGMQKISLMGLVGGIAALGLLALLVTVPVLAEPAWVSGEVRLNLRLGLRIRIRFIFQF